MKATIKIKKEIELQTVRVVIPIREYNEDIPADLPFLKDGVWDVVIDLDSHKIIGWPDGYVANFCEKVRDGGNYYLRDATGEVILSIEENYVPNDLLPGEYGDYLEMEIDGNGIVTNWPDFPSIEEFQKDEEVVY